MEGVTTIPKGSTAKQLEASDIQYNFSKIKRNKK
jgi:hypothetical protein